MLEIDDPVYSDQTVYETYRTGAENPYVSGFVPEVRWVAGNEANPEEDELMQLEAEITNNEPDSPDETQGLVNNPSYIDNDGR